MRAVRAVRAVRRYGWSTAQTPGFGAFGFFAKKNTRVASAAK